MRFVQTFAKRGDALKAIPYVPPEFLLTLYPTDEGSEWDFKNLTHEEFVGQIRSLLGRYVSDANTRYLTMFLDFLNTLENLRRERLCL